MVENKNKPSESTKQVYNGTEVHRTLPGPIGAYMGLGQHVNLAGVCSCIKLWAIFSIRASQSVISI